MRKNSPRKWIHAILDLLPVILIPVFMVYSHRHTIDNYTVVRSENNFVTLKQDIINGKPYSTDSWDFGAGYNCNLTYVNNKMLVQPIADGDAMSFGCHGGDINLNHDILLTFDFDYQGYDTSFYVYNSGDYDNYFSDDVVTLEYGVHNFNFIKNFSQTENDYIYICFEFEDTQGFYGYIYNVQLFDLTTIFGSGNEPSTYEDFKTYCPLDYYDYDVAYSIAFGTHSVTYNDTDIGSQFVYTLYNTTDKYFNMNKVFNLESFWSWINTNLFGGNAPLMANVVWNIIVYEFVIDLFFVFYGFFMFLIDFVDNMLDRPFNKGR